MKLPDRLMNSEQFIDEPLMAERTLWMAVVERAMKDYCFFFDWWESATRVYRQKSSKNPKIKPRVDMSQRAICEFNRLQWFLFDTEKRAFNLEYITSELYDDQGVKQKLRRMAREQFRLNLDSAISKNKFPNVTKYILENTTAGQAEPAAKISSLKQKRYRIIFD